MKLIAEAHTNAQIAADPPPVREDGRVPPRQRPAQARDARPGRARPLRDPARPRRAVEPTLAATGAPAVYHRRRAPAGRPHRGPAVPARSCPWINVATLRMDQQLGRPVLIEFWDFCRAELDPHAAVHEGVARALRAARAAGDRRAHVGLRAVRRPRRGGGRGRAARSALPGRGRHRATRSGSCTATSAGRRATCSTSRACCSTTTTARAATTETERAIQELLGIEQPTARRRCGPRTRRARCSTPQSEDVEGAVQRPVRGGRRSGRCSTAAASVARQRTRARRSTIPAATS